MAPGALLKKCVTVQIRIGSAAMQKVVKCLYWISYRDVTTVYANGFSIQEKNFSADLLLVNCIWQQIAPQHEVVGGKSAN
jgi:hypothetical protein